MNQIEMKRMKTGLKYLGAVACGVWAFGGVVPGGVAGGVADGAWSGVVGGMAAARAQSAVAVAMVIGVKGSPQVAADGKWSKLRLGARLASGQIVKCPPNSDATIVLFQSGDRFRVAPGKSAIVSASQVKGAAVLGAAGAVSPLVARALAGSRTGSVVSRTAGGYGLFSLLPAANANANAGDDASRPELGFLAQGTTSFDVPWISATSEKVGTQKALFTLYDSDSDAVYSTSQSTARVELPADFAPRLRRSYVWSLVSFSDTTPLSAANLKRETPQWGMVTWLARDDARQVSEAVGPGSLDSLGAGEAVAATMAVGLLQERKINGGAWRLLNILRNRKVAGAEDAFFELYVSTPSIAKFFSGYASEFSTWKSKQDKQ